MSNSPQSKPKPAPLPEDRQGRARSCQTERLELANQIIRIIAAHGRRFLSLSSDRRTPLPESEDRYSRFEFVSGRLWYVDKWREARIFVHYDPKTRAGWGWRFSDGGTLLSLCRALRDFIRTGDCLFLRHLGPFPEWSCGGDLWGYGAEMAAVREKAAALLNAHGMAPDTPNPPLRSDATGDRGLQAQQVNDLDAATDRKE